MTHQEIIEDFFAYSFDSPEAPESTERYWEKALLDDKGYVIPSDNVCGYIRRLLRIPYGEFLSYVRQNLPQEPIESKNITQCSSFVACERDLCKIFLEQNNPGLSYEEIGRFLKKKMVGSNNEDAFKKYGENQVKTAKQLGLAFDYYGDWYLSILGYVYLSLSPEEQSSLIARTLLRDRLYASILSDIVVFDVDLLSYMDCISSESTKARRYGCVEFLVNICLKECRRQGVYTCEVKRRKKFQGRDERIANQYSSYTPIAYNDDLPTNLARRTQILISEEITRSKKYLQLISSIPPLNTSEERELLARSLNGDKEAFDTICESHLPEIYKLAVIYNESFPNVDVQDLVGEGVLALCRSIYLFKPYYGSTFIYFAIGEIKKRMQACVDEYTYLMHFPLRIRELKEDVDKVCAKFEQEKEREPLAEEIAEILDMPVERIEGALEMSVHHESIDVPFVYKGNDNLANVIIDEDTQNPLNLLFNESLLYEVKRALRMLTPREAEIIKQFYGIGTQEKTPEEIGETLHITRERVRQIKEKAIRRLQSGSCCYILRTYLCRRSDLSDIDTTNLKVNQPNNIESKEVNAAVRQEELELQKIKKIKAKEERLREKAEMSKKELEVVIQRLLSRNLNTTMTPTDKNKRYNYFCRLISETRKIISLLFEWVKLKQNVASLEMIKINGKEDVIDELDKNYAILARESDISQKTIDELRTNINILRKLCKNTPSIMEEE